MIWSPGVLRPAVAGSKPVTLASADLDHDPACIGCQDLVVGDRRAKVVNVYLGNGDGTFQTPKVLSMGAAVLAVATLDCDGDGDIDILASTVSSTRALTVFVNQEQQGNPGKFVESAASPIAVPAGGPSVLLTHDSSGQPLDVDGDGAADVAIIAHGKRLGMMLGDGSCGFGAPTETLRQGKLTGVAAADLDGANGVDLVVTDRRSHHADVLSNDGGGGFTLTNSLDVGTRPSAVVGADVNADGRTDLLVINADNAVAPMNLGLGRIFNFGNGLLSATSLFGAGGRRPVAVIAGTFTADAIVDAVVLNQVDNVIALAPGDGVGFTTPSTSPTGGTKPVAIAATDFDGDGLLDVAVANAGAGGVSVCPGNGTTFACAPIVAGP